MSSCCSPPFLTSKTKTETSSPVVVPCGKSYEDKNTFTNKLLPPLINSLVIINWNKIRCTSVLPQRYSHNWITFLLALCIVQMLLFSKPGIGSPMSYGKSLAGSLEKKDHIVELTHLYPHMQTALNPQCDVSLALTAARQNCKSTKVTASRMHEDAAEKLSVHDVAPRSLLLDKFQCNSTKTSAVEVRSRIRGKTERVPRLTRNWNCVSTTRCKWRMRISARTITSHRSATCDRIFSRVASRSATALKLERDGGREDPTRSDETFAR